jgi:hypothetical protein
MRSCCMNTRDPQASSLPPIGDSPRTFWVQQGCGAGAVRGGSTVRAEGPWARRLRRPQATPVPTPPRARLLQGCTSPLPSRTCAATASILRGPTRSVSCSRRPSECGPFRGSPPSAMRDTSRPTPGEGEGGGGVGAGSEVGEGQARCGGFCEMPRKKHQRPAAAAAAGGPPGPPSQEATQAAPTRVVVGAQQPVLKGVNLQRVEHVLDVGAQHLEGAADLGDVAGAEGAHAVHQARVRLALRKYGWGAGMGWRVECRGRGRERGCWRAGWLHVGAPQQPPWPPPPPVRRGCSCPFPR